MRRWIAFSAAIAVIGAVLLPVAASAQECADYLVIGARGSNQISEDATRGMGPEIAAFAEEMKVILERNEATVDFAAVDYPAVAPWGAGQKKIPSGSVKETAQTAYPGSVSDGVSNLLRFNPRDTAAVSGDFVASRAGFFGPRDLWSEHLDVPVISVCREGDFFCQWRVYRQTTIGTSGQSAETAVADPVAIFDWASTHWNRNPWLFWDGPNNDLLFAEHTNYGRNAQPIQAANDLADRMGLSSAGSSHGAQEPIDVAIMIDSTGGASAVVSELQSRAAEFVDLVTDNVAGSRVAVVDFKGADIDESNPYRVHVNGFSSDPQDAIDAIQAIEPGGGEYGVIYSAVNAVHDLPWRKGVRKITLSLIASRACGVQICSHEAGTGVSVPTPLDRPLSRLRASGVYTLDNWWFFESAGWAAALQGDTPYTARPGGWATPSGQVDELERVFRTALSDPWDSLKGTDTAVAGESGYFSADALLPYYSTSDARRLRWSSTWAGPLSDGGPTAGIVAGRDSTEAEPCEPEDTCEDPAPCDEPDGCEPDVPEPLPVDEGPFYQVAFDRPGFWDVEVTAYLDGEVITRSTRVRVDPTPATAPAAPLLTSFVDDGDQVLTWMAGAGEPAAAYAILDQAGDLVDTVIPVAEIGRNGVVDFEYSVPLGVGEDPTYTIAAVNATGTTAATALISASRSTYEHAVQDEGEITGGILQMSGASTPEIAILKSRLSESSTAATASGPYDATLTSPSGASLNIDMSSVSTDVSIESDEWSISLQLGDVTDREGTPVWETMRDGFADELLTGGYLDLRIGGASVRIKIAPTADTSQPGEFIIDPHSTPSPGAVVDAFSADPATTTLTLSTFGPFDPMVLPLATEGNAPDFNWAAAPVTDVRTWIGTAEVSNTLKVDLTAFEPSGEENPGTITIQATGAIASGRYADMRAFLSSGTISFRVADGATNTLSLQMSAGDAEDAYPVPVVTPAFIGTSTVKFSQYRDQKVWKPVIQWGSAAPGTVVVDGQLTDGLWFDWDSQGVQGTPVHQGTYPVSITATNDAGQVTRAFSIVVGPNTEGSPFRLNRSRLYRNQDDTMSVILEGSNYFRADNPGVTPWLPIITQLDEYNGYLWGDLDDVTLTDQNGNDIPITGEFGIEMWSSTDGYPDWIGIHASDANISDGTAGTVNELFKSGATISFTFEGGSRNVLRLAPLDNPIA